MPHTPGTGLADRPTAGLTGDVVDDARALLTRPGLVVVAGGPGSGRTTVLQRLAAGFRGPVFTGGGLAMLQDVPALALSRAVRVRLPAHDASLLAEAVRSRVRTGLLVVDDLQWADAASVAAVAALAAHTRVVVALRSPHRLPPEAVASLRAAASGWLTLPPLGGQAAADLARRVAPGLGPSAVADVVRRAGGVPLAVTALARHAAARPSTPSSGPARGVASVPGIRASADSTDAFPAVPSPSPPPAPEVDQVAYAVATALADLPRPARTAMAALGLLGRPATPALLGPGVDDLVEAGLVVPATATLGPGDASPPAPARPPTSATSGDAVPPAAPARPPAPAGSDAAGGVVPSGPVWPVAPVGSDPADDVVPSGPVWPVAPAGSDPAGGVAPPAVPSGLAWPPAAAASGPSGGVVPSAGAVRQAMPGGSGPAGGVVPLDPARSAGAGGAASPGLGRAGSAGDGALVVAASPYVAEVAAGMLDDEARRALHRRLAELTPDREAARHLAAAGDDGAAYARAVAAAGAAATAGEQADLLLLACTLPGARPDPATRVAAATAALASGRPRAAVRVLTTAGPLGVDAAVLRAEALLQVGDLAGARAAASPVPDDAPDLVRAGRDRILLLARLAADPAGAAAAAARHGDAPDHPGLRAAVAAVLAAGRAPGWEYGLASAAQAAGQAGDALTARWSAWLLVETLAADGRLEEAARTAETAAAACAADLAYSWQSRFLAAGLWCAALRGSPATPEPTPASGDAAGDGATAGRPTGAPAALVAGVAGPAAGGAGRDGVTAARVDDVLRRAADLTDRTVPALARAYAVAAASLVEADGGLLAPARARLAAAPVAPAAAALLDWVGREAAWLDGQPDRAALAGETAGPPLLDGLRRITAQWAAYDGASADALAYGVGPSVDPADLDAGRPAAALPAVRETLTAWSDGGGFDRAAAAWHDLAVREEVRCLLAAGLHETDPARAVPPLLEAERLAEQAGLVVLLGRARRALRRHAVRRESRGPRSGSELTERERDVLRLVARGEPTRRIAGQLGISAETVETHIRAGMRKLGARTRTAAAAMALEMLG